jgi:hypothetical protein
MREVKFGFDKERSSVQPPFGHSVSLTFDLTRRWLNLGAGWAALAGLLASGYAQLDLTALLQLISLWILVDPILGTLWDLAVERGLVRRFTRAELPAPAARGVDLPYAQPGSVAGHAVILLRRYSRWWAAYFWPTFSGGITTCCVGLILALVIGLALGPTVFWLVVLTVGLTVLAGLALPDHDFVDGSRLRSIVQFLLPWLMGAVLWSDISLLALVLGLAYWTVYLGSLRMLGNQHRAEWLFYPGQFAVSLLLLALHLLPGAVVLGILLLAQLLVRTNYGDDAAVLLRKSQAYVVIGLLVAGLSVGSL